MVSVSVAPGTRMLPALSTCPTAAPISMVTLLPAAAGSIRLAASMDTPESCNAAPVPLSVIVLATKLVAVSSSVPVPPSGAGTATTMASPGAGSPPATTATASASVAQLAITPASLGSLVPP